MGLEANGHLYSGANETGSSLLIGIAHGDRYLHENGASLRHDKFWANVLSGTMNASANVDVNLILCQWENFDGSYLQASVPKGGASLSFNVQPALGWVGSFIIAASSPASEVRLSFKDMFLKQWKDTISAQLGSNASLNGDPLLDWDMFDETQPYLEPSQAYLTVLQPLIIHVPSPFTDYHASLKYWIYLFPSGTGLRASVPEYWWYLDGGALHDCIKDKFVPQVEQGATTLQNALNTQLAQFDGLAPKGVHDVYYLPGNQTSPRYGLSQGDTSDDVTIVIAPN